MNHKFPFRIFCHQLLDLDNMRFKQVSGSLPDGDYELILRPKTLWNTEQMRKYFHGPVRKHFVDGYRNLGINKTADNVKRDIKDKYGSQEDKKLPNGKIVRELKSTGDYTREDYIELLKGANLLSIDHLECELPPAEMVD